MTKYTIYFGTSDRNGKALNAQRVQQFIEEGVRRYLGGAATLTTAVGYWESRAEGSKIITYLGTDFDARDVERFAHDYKRAFNQDSVLVTSSQEKASFI